jgi:hypothetical protein
LQEEAANHREVRRSRAGVLSVAEKARSSASGVSREGERERTADDVSKAEDDIETEVEAATRDEPGGNLSTAQAVSGIKAARARLRLPCGT